MGKASSSKKVARAARAAGRPGARRNIGWPLLIGAVVVVGVLLVVVSRGNNEEAGPPRLGDHWHAAYGIYDCTDFLPNLTDEVPDESGLHTHSDGLMHIHPFGTRYTGEGANIGNWGETVGLELSDTRFKAGTIERENGDECADGQEGTVQLKVWDSPADEEGRLIDGDFAEWAPEDQSMFVIAFVPEGTEIPKPPQANIDSLAAPIDTQQGATSVPPQTIPIDPTATTAPGTETTAPGTETTAPGTETTAPGTETTAPATETTAAPPATTTP